MFRSLLLTLVLAGVPGGLLAAQEAPPLFRHIDLGVWGTVELGDTFSQAHRIAIEKSDGVFELRPGTYGGAAMIRIQLGPTGRVASMHFEYDPQQSDFNAYLHTTSESFGPATLESRTVPDGERHQVARWEDERTILEVVRRTSGEVSEVFVGMYDRAQLSAPGA